MGPVSSPSLSPLHPPPQTLPTMKVFVLLAVVASALARPQIILGSTPFEGTTSFRHAAVAPITYSAPLTYSAPFTTTYTGSFPIVYSAGSFPSVSSGLVYSAGTPLTFTNVANVKAVAPKVVAATSGSSHVVY